MPGKAIDEERIRQVLMNLDGWDTPITTSRVKRKNIIQNAHAKMYTDLYFTEASDSEIDEAEEERADV